MNKKNLDVYLCEPFILPGILPTLGVSTLKTMLTQNNISCEIYYSSLRFYINNKLYDNEIFNGILNNIPLQLVEYLFSDINQKASDELIVKEMLKKHTSEEVKIGLDKLKYISHKYLDEVANIIVKSNPKILCYSLTFGDFNYAFSLFEKIKKLNHNIIIIVGGSSCLPKFSETLLNNSKEIDYVVCDETFDITIKLIKELLLNSNSNIVDEYVSSRISLANNVKKILNLDRLPVPNFDDYFKTLDELNIDQSKITLPYEMSRGCWWAEKRACTMCGFFGNQHKFLIKSPEKVIKEIDYLANKYNVDKFRFSDLVQPKYEYLEKISQIEDKYKVFWELRPGLKAKDIEKLRKIGLTSAQIGIESFSTEELKLMNKGAIGIENIAMLINFSTYKINIIWNYLYGFEEDKEEWYEKIIDIIPSLYHLQPPSVREIWINKHSELFEKKNKEDIIPIGKDIFHSDLSDELEFFYKNSKKRELELVYEKLISIILKWNENFEKGYELYVEKIEDGKITIIREYDKKETYKLNKIESIVYTYFYTPNSFEKAVAELGIESNVLKEILNKFIEQKLMIFLDNQYLSLVTRASKYKWTKFNEQVSYTGEYILKGYKENGI